MVTFPEAQGLGFFVHFQLIFKINFVISRCGLSYTLTFCAAIVHLCKLFEPALYVFRKPFLGEMSRLLVWCGVLEYPVAGQVIQSGNCLNIYTVESFPFPRWRIKYRRVTSV